MLCGTSLSRRRTPIAARTKIEVSPALCRRLQGLDDLARVLFPDNRNHRLACVVFLLALKYAENAFLASSSDWTRSYAISPRTAEIVRAKLRRLGIVRRVSHFDPAHGNRSGWVFCDRFCQALLGLASAVRAMRQPADTPCARDKDTNAVLYV